MNATSDERMLGRPEAAAVMIAALTFGTLTGLTALGVGVGVAAAVVGALIFLALAGGVLSNWSP